MKFYIILVSSIIFVFFIGYYKNKRRDDNIENFAINTIEKFKECTEPHKIYDKFYSGIYDELFLSTYKNQYEILQIRENIFKKWKKENGKMKILDVGCGLGHHVEILNNYKYETIGLDISKHMIDKAKVLYPLLDFKEGDMTDKTNFEPNSFSHITCFFFSVYYVENIHKLFETVNQWLKRGGVFIVHLVDKRKFDPVLEKNSGLIPLYNPQKYSRKTKTTLKFNNFSYEADWKLSNNPVIFTELFKFKENQIRKNVHKLNISTMKKYVDTATNTGFKLIQTIDLSIVNHSFNYLFCFEKIYG